MQTNDGPWTFVIEPRRFRLLIEGRLRHHLMKEGSVAVDDLIVFQERGTQRKATYSVTFVDEPIDDTADIEGSRLHIVALKLQEWASPDTA